MLDDRNFKTEATYKQGLLSVTAIFDAKPGTKEFDELLILLRLIKNYEENELKFPKLEIPEVVTHRMNMFNMTAIDLSAMLKIEDINQFLIGNQSLRPKILTRLYKLIGIKFPVNDQRFCN